MREKLRAYEGTADIRVYVTKARGDASDYIRLCRAQEEGMLRFYACGGDGTLNEVVNGAYGLRQVEVGCYPCGSGNDYVKYYGGREAFLDLGRQLNGKSQRVDLMDAGGRLAINMVHFGLDSAVAKTMIRWRRVPVLGGKNAYYAGVVSALLQPLGTPCTLWVDGEQINKDKLLLCTIANGQYVGGGYRAAPRSDNGDGVLDVCLVRPLPRIRMLGLMKAYREGTHLEDPRLKDSLSYRQGQHVRIEGKERFVMLLDGELYDHKDVDVRVIPDALSFVLPEGLNA